MLRTFAMTLLLLAFLGPATAQASTCLYRYMDDAGFASASSIFVFRLISATVEDGPPNRRYRNVATGTIRVVESLRGPAGYRQLQFATGGCGSKLLPGLYYLAVTSDDGTTFRAGTHSVIDLEGIYWEGQDNARTSPPFRRVVAAVRGSMRLSEAMPDRSSIQYFPTPAPPPPPEACPSPLPAKREENGNASRSPASPRPESSRAAKRLEP